MIIRQRAKNFKGVFEQNPPACFCPFFPPGLRWEGEIPLDGSLCQNSP